MSQTLMRDVNRDKKNQVLIITGMSGSGKTSALRALEDIGFFCIDNLPVVLLPKLLKIKSEEALHPARVAMVMDLREEGFLGKYEKVFRKLEKKGYSIEIVFLDASDYVLLQRYSETRRTHPLSVHGSILTSIADERAKMAPLKAMASKIIDTTSFNVHQIKATIQRLFVADQVKSKLLFIHLLSFGFRYGVPVDADIILDVRFLPNPHFVEKLKLLNGNNPRVRDYVLTTPEAEYFREKISELFDFLLPRYEREGKTRLTIAFGCTGGKHRSVVMANALTARLASADYCFQVSHRDIAKTESYGGCC